MTNPEELSLREAIEILSAHNDWRRGLRDLRKAVDLAISVLECEIRQHAESPQSNKELTKTNKTPQ